MSIQTVNPNTNKIVKSFEEMKEKTVEWTVVAMMINNGQCCVASKRFMAVEAIAEEFIQKFKDKLSKIKGDNLLDDLGELLTKMGGKVMIIPNEKMPTKTGFADLFRY